MEGKDLAMLFNLWRKFLQAEERIGAERESRAADVEELRKIERNIMGDGNMAPTNPNDIRRHVSTHNIWDFDVKGRPTIVQDRNEGTPACWTQGAHVSQEGSNRATTIDIFNIKCGSSRAANRANQRRFCGPVPMPDGLGDSNKTEDRILQNSEGMLSRVIMDVYSRMCGNNFPDLHKNERGHRQVHRSVPTEVVAPDRTFEMLSQLLVENQELLNSRPGDAFFQKLIMACMARIRLLMVESMGMTVEEFNSMEDPPIEDWEASRRTRHNDDSNNSTSNVDDTSNNSESTNTSNNRRRDRDDIPESEKKPEASRKNRRKN